MNLPVDVLAIVGPTASGKTALSVALANLFDGEIINGDAMQVYKELDIGTAKIHHSEMQGIPHHFFDVKEPTESFSVAEYQLAVRQWIADIQSRGKLPILVGGSGMYVQSVLFDYRFTEQAADPEVRARLERELESEGADVLHARLAELDLKSSEKIHPNNHRRLVRALEILEVTGQTKQDHEQQQGNQPMYHSLIIGLDLPRQLLYERIDLRVEQMVQAGLFNEVQQLWNKGIRQTQSVQAIGYKELISYFDGQLTKEQAIEAVKKNTRNYAKRQLTYFRNKLPVQWVDANQPAEEIFQTTCKIIKGFKK
ncbi:tRNA (adenosine(37)-N6)-dimethylallyltransferase MiaA [Sporosarcina sp. P21c]|uniref:tRNA (adenosine(37)-N6)-dimethylallyltransferase MiaA n=1 Tax=Sporosarcina TaxID=1569 RepID=UPI000A14AB3D|nr:MULTISPECIES: tRNA (adenosine(37)-N6)-dimethylallyltransferase MiaA [Sporosarcina]ARJ40106.1 tRNA (adenosine(37)-N6)-dimethylallyltransferase MiaA [Sporosarcina ureae]PIC68697.1 tRNA (adenosine(37)-N6)-dimethylallyltransferase MiaA [Sporosarcina sp. P16a]PIC84531.1 tRNA (adenosine(37)-N6)-dimethylallyltransferase MiaA [Sporosarcina sp. P1]PIC91119.1 tRNA (adenosine(37)-N6)-dimethylallyltransferase MiaA [Sporosarcina sp. P21c]PIC93749.1 tRNA (adenosine(37)-N6)-dimethylallyltransferase MiaA [